MPFELCRHIRTGGIRCQSPAIKGGLWCFFHARFHACHRNIRPEKPKRDAITLPPLEDSDAIQTALSLVVAAIASGRLDEKRARAILQAITLASRNIKVQRLVPSPEDAVQSFMPTLDGLPLANRAMSDNSAPPPYPPAQPPLPPS
jgi:hypothetical protein